MRLPSVTSRSSGLRRAFFILFATASAGFAAVKLPPPLPDPFTPYIELAPFKVNGKQLAISILARGINVAGAATTDPIRGDGATAPLVLRVEGGRFGASVDLARVPEPTGHDIRGFHPDVAEELRELGYVE